MRWKLVIDKYKKHKGYGLGTLVAFSGEVNDPESRQEVFTETGPHLNQGLKRRDIWDAFKGKKYHLLMVASKFQIRFDQPLLC